MSFGCACFVCWCLSRTDLGAQGPETAPLPLNTGWAPNETSLQLHERVPPDGVPGFLINRFSSLTRLHVTIHSFHHLMVVAEHEIQKPTETNLVFMQRHEHEQ